MRSVEPRDDMPYFGIQLVTLFEGTPNSEFKIIPLTAEQEAINYCLDMGKDHDEAIKNLRETVAQQSETINKLQQEILELKTMMEKVSS